MKTPQLTQLGRLRWAVRATLALGIAASVAANVLHANPNPISQAISAWPPLALLLTVELTSRIPMHKRGLAALRVLSTVAIAGIAAWVSYWHMQGVADRYGEVGVSAYLLPVTVDGLIVVASVSMVELAGRIRALEERAAPATTVEPATTVAPAIVAPVAVAPAVVAAATSGRSTRPRGRTSAANRSTTVTGRVRKPAAERREEIAKVRAERPDATQPEIARELGISDRHVRRLDDSPAT